ncbi:hypothetical protein VUR80DRAFT_5883 [Thermomyces stellatus]
MAVAQAPAERRRRGSTVDAGCFPSMICDGPSDPLWLNRYGGRGTMGYGPRVVGEGDLDRYCSDKDPLAGKRTRILCSLTCQETGVEADKIAYVLSGLHGDLTIAATTYWYGVPAALPSSGAGSEFRIIWARL